MDDSSEILKAGAPLPAASAPLPAQSAPLPAQSTRECEATVSSDARGPPPAGSTDPAVDEIDETLQVRIASLMSALDDTDADSDIDDGDESQNSQRRPSQAPNDSDTSPSKYMRLPRRRLTDTTELSADLEPLLQKLLARSGGCFCRDELAALLTNVDVEEDIAMFDDILQSFDNLADELADEDDLEGEGGDDLEADDHDSSTPACTMKPRRPSQAIGLRRSYLNETRWVEAGARDSCLTTELLTKDKYATMRGLLAADMVSLARCKNIAVRADASSPVLPLPPSSSVDRHNKRKMRRDERRQVSGSRLGFGTTGLSSACASEPIAQPCPATSSPKR